MLLKSFNILKEICVVKLPRQITTYLFNVKYVIVLLTTYECVLLMAPTLHISRDQQISPKNI